MITIVLLLCIAMLEIVEKKDAFGELESVFRARPGKWAVAFSGGVDSAVVLAAAKYFATGGVVAVVGKSLSFSEQAWAQVQQVVDFLDVPLEIVYPSEQDDARYVANSGDRCFYCKMHLYETIQSVLPQLNADYLVNGTHADDIVSLDRPGLKAQQNCDVLSPLALAGLDKQAVRDLASLWQLPVAEVESNACLASRVPVGLPVTPEALSRIEKAEAALRGMGFKRLRVRDHNELARVEVLEVSQAAVLERADEVVLLVREAGYRWVTLDLLPYRPSGLTSLTIAGGFHDGKSINNDLK